MRSTLQKPFTILDHKPSWFTIQPKPHAFQHIKNILHKHNLHSICEEAHCPNLPECWGQAKTATFLLMGDTCTRTCKFCHVRSGKPQQLDPEEPQRVAAAVTEAGFDYVVLTSVNRDDIPDGGAAHLASCIRAIKTQNPALFVEVLIPDFQGNKESLKTIMHAHPDVIAHNLETVERLQTTARDHRANYWQSLNVLSFAKTKSTYTKTSLMLGLGETEDEIIQTCKDARAQGVDFITLGQYLPPSIHHLPVVTYVSPEIFQDLKEKIKHLGFLFVAAGPFVRSSYRAGELFIRGLKHESIRC